MASKVLYLEQLPSHWTEAQLREALAPFGDVRKIVLLRKRNALYAGYNPTTLEPIRATTIQALVEAADVDAAAHMLQQLQQRSLVVGGGGGDDDDEDGAGGAGGGSGPRRAVTASYSKNQELRERHAVHSDRFAHHLGTGGTAANGGGDGNRILLVTVQNPTYPITTDLMHGVFNTYGRVEKIVVFVKPVGLQCLIQFATLEEAVAAKHALNGLSIFPDCCGLVIHFSNLPQELIVKENGMRTKDFTNPALPVPANDSAINSGSDMHVAPLYGYAAPVAAVPPASMITAAAAAAAGAVGGHAAPRAYTHPLQAAQHPHHVPHPHHAHHHAHHHHPHHAHAGAMLPPPPAAVVPGAVASRDVVSPVLLVCNLHESVTCDHLFHLFSCYGNVTRVKKLAAKSDHALVQFLNQLAAQSALVHLRGFTLLGRSLEISYSKHAYIAIRPPAPTTTPATVAGGHANGDPTVTNASSSHQDTALPKEYGQSVNRFTGKYANGTKHIYSPTKIVHISNLDDSVTAEQLREHLASFPAGGEHCKVQLFTNSNGHIQALAEFPTVDAATNVLAQAHNAPLGSRRLKLAFSRKTLHS